MSSFFLEALSGWKLPSLKYLNIYSYDETHPADALTGLESHGATLRYITLRYFDAGHTVSQDMLKTSFTLCTNLRSMKFYFNEVPAFEILPSHPNLEKLCITSSQCENGINAELYERFKLFKSMAPTLFPKLVEAKLINAHHSSNWTAFFHTGNEFITMRERKRVSRNYDGGRIETGT